MTKKIASLICILFSFIGIATASSVSLTWDNNTEADLAGYRLFMSTFSLINASTESSMSINSIIRSTYTENVATINLKTGTSYYFRLTAFDASGNQSGFNLDLAGNGEEVVAFIKNGDANKDNIVDSVDYSLFRKDWHIYNARSDFNNDGTVNSLDYILLRSGWKK